MGRKWKKMKSSHHVSASDGAAVPSKSGRKHLFLWFMGLMEKRLPLYLGAILLSSCGAAFARIANAWIVESVIASAQNRDAEGLFLRVGLQFAAFVFGWWMWRVGIIRYNIEGRRGIARLEKMVLSKALRLPFSYYEDHHSGDFISKLIYDTERAGDIYSSRFRRLSSAVISTVVYLIPMFCYSPSLTLCLLVISMFSFLGNTLFLKPMKTSGGALAAGNGKLLEHLTNMLSGLETVKMFPVGEMLLQMFSRANEACFKAQKKTNLLGAGLESLNSFLDLMGALAFLGLGVWFAAAGRISLGELTALYTLYGSFRYVFLDIGRYLPQMMNCLANVENLYDFLQLPEEPQQYDVPAGSSERGRIRADQTDAEKEQEGGRAWAVRMEHIDFGYQKERKIFFDFTLRIPEGKCVAVAGESGCGKSTLAKLLLGFYAPEGGYIEICGMNRRNGTLRQMRRMIAYVPQEPYLFEVTIAENIAYGLADSGRKVTMEEIILAARTANAHEFIQKLPQGYQTIPGERGNTLSGGERQRIAIARAVLKNAPILLLDEATSALDNESERLINEALDRLRAGRTTIMIAHRPSALALADEVVRIPV